MSKIIAALTVIGFAVNVNAQDFTNVTKVKTETYTNVVAVFDQPTDRTNVTITAFFTGTRWEIPIRLQKSDGSFTEAAASLTDNNLLDALNRVAGVTMTADVTNAIKKLPKAFEKGAIRKGNNIIDALNP